MNPSTYLILVLAIAAGATALPKSSSSKQHSVVEIGVVGNKTYFVETVEVGWFEGYLDCVSHNLSYATAETAEERTFLLETLLAMDQASHYWVGAREQFVWETTGDVVVDIGEIDLYGGYDCLSLRVDPTATLWDSRVCDELWPALCQSSA